MSRVLDPCRCCLPLLATLGADIATCPHCDSPCFDANCPRCDLLKRTCTDCRAIYATPMARESCERRHRWQ